MNEFSSPPACLRLVALMAAAGILAACTTPPPMAIAPTPPLEHHLPDNATQALAQRFPTLKVVSDSRGTLRADGPDAIAAVLGGPDAGGEFTIALLERDDAAVWHIVGASHPIFPGCEKCSVGVDLAPGGLYVHVIRAKDTDYENFTYRFAPADAADPLRLVGVTAFIPSRPDDPHSHSFSASVDLLTGKRTDVVDDTSADAPMHRERQSTLAVRPALAFDDFAFTADALDAETRALPPVVFDRAGVLPPAVAETLRERFPQMVLMSQASGALRGDGGRDIAAVLVPADRTLRAGAAADAVVAVLLAQPDGSLRVADVSGAMAHDCATCDVQVRIARHALDVQTNDVGAGGSVSVDYQFGYRPNDASLRLVALRTETATRGGDTGAIRSVTTTDMVSGKRVDVVDGVVNGRRNRSEQKSQQPPRELAALSDFRFDAAALADATAADASAVPASASLSGS